MESIKKIREIKGDSSRIGIYWMLTNWCNFSCSYCAIGARSGSLVPLQPSTDRLMSFCDRLGDLLKEGKMIEINLSGGEPTVHADLPKILKRLHPDIYTIVTTNGSRPTAWWKSLEVLPDHVIFSIHRQSNLSKIIPTAEYLLESGKGLAFNCCMDADEWERAVAGYNDLAERFGYRARKKVINALDYTGDIQTDPQPLTEEQKAFMRAPHATHDPYPEITENSRNVINRKLGKDKVTVIEDDGTEHVFSTGTARSNITRHDLHHWKGWICHAGMESFHVTPTGDIWAGFCRMKKISHIDDFRPATSPLICLRTTCICPGDITVSKRNPW